VELEDMLALGLEDIEELDDIELAELEAVVPAASSEPPQPERPRPRAPARARAEKVRVRVEVVISWSSSSRLRRRDRRPAVDPPFEAGLLRSVTG